MGQGSPSPESQTLEERVNLWGDGKGLQYCGGLGGGEGLWVLWEVQGACSPQWGGSVPCEGPLASAWGEEEVVSPWGSGANIVWKEGVYRNVEVWGGGLCVETGWW